MRRKATKPKMARRYVQIQAQLNPDDPGDAARIAAFEAAVSKADFIRSAIDTLTGRVTPPPTQTETMIRELFAEYLGKVQSGVVKVVPEQEKQDLISKAAKFGL